MEKNKIESIFVSKPYKKREKFNSHLYGEKNIKKIIFSPNLTKNKSVMNRKSKCI